MATFAEMAKRVNDLNKIGFENEYEYVDNLLLATESGDKGAMSKLVIAYARLKEPLKAYTWAKKYSAQFPHIEAKILKLCLENIKTYNKGFKPQK